MLFSVSPISDFITYIATNIDTDSQEEQILHFTVSLTANYFYITENGRLPQEIKTNF